MTLGQLIEKSYKIFLIISVMHIYYYRYIKIFKSNMFDIINLILLIIVIFILIMLRSVLGRRTGLEKPVIIDFDEPKNKAAETAQDDDVGSLLEIHEDEKNISSYLSELRYLEKSLSGFSLKYFKEGAIKAYEMILIGHSEEDHKTLNSLLGKELYEDFKASIDARNKAAQKLEYSMIKVSELQIDDIKIEKNIASITCSINAATSSIISEFKDDEKSTKRNSVKTREVWTFSKNLKSKDPNWKVISISRLN